MERLQNFVDGKWSSSSAPGIAVLNPAFSSTLAEVPLSTASDVNSAVEAAERAFPGWRQTPVVERVQPLFKLKGLLEENRQNIERQLKKLKKR